jgi:flagellar biosynthesis protein FliQ
MNQTDAIEIGREAIMVVLTMSVPIMAVALFVGLIIALFQAFKHKEQ